MRGEEERGEEGQEGDHISIDSRTATNGMIAQQIPSCIIVDYTHMFRAYQRGLSTG
jgi:hypothetical protein